MSQPVDLPVKIGMLIDQYYNGKAPVVVEGLKQHQLQQCSWISTCLNSLELAQLPVRVQDLLKHWSNNFQWSDDNQTQYPIVATEIPQDYLGRQNGDQHLTQKGIPYRTSVARDSTTVILSIEIMIVPPSVAPECYRESE